MSLVISDIKTDLPKLNKELQRLDSLQQQLDLANKKLANQDQRLKLVQGHQSDFTPTNNLVFTWANPNLTWPAGWIRDNTGRNFPVPAGTISGLTNTGVYWLGWNDGHQVMASSHSLSDIAVPLIITVCRVTLNAGVVGCGGHDPGGVGPNGHIY